MVKTIHYSNKLRSSLVTILPMASFTTKSTSKLKSALHFRYVDSYSMVHSLSLILSVSKILSSILIPIITVVFVTLLAEIIVCVVTVYSTQ